MLTKKDRRARTKGVETLRRTRMANLKALAEHLGSPAELARRMGVTASYINQLCGPNPVRGITEDTARDIEQKLGIVSGWLDVVH
jgi:plasmid maintenance system antidote protein VapI